ncbi:MULTISPECIES: DUF1707 domain-containing protein [unclassified Nocardia]|uniref:DUF1707 SHOCT-like domain-containing protein n=1 Tax=unclassified Nocardia TaxID=2637762 RepID=UPI001CE3E540|nr:MULTISPECIES: DUF1707 domain-containing protein [unclassified Nocardia]
MELSTGTRASDAERERVVRLLGRHMADGRIDLAEYDQRVARVYATATREELSVVLSDLPRLKDSVAQRNSRVPIWQRIEGGSWFGVSVLVLVIWGAISLGVGSLTYFWPMWVIGPWGAVLVFRMLAGFEAGRCFGHPRRARG